MCGSVNQEFKELPAGNILIKSEIFLKTLV